MTGSEKSGIARWRDTALHSAEIFHVTEGTPASVKLYMPSGGGPSAVAGLADPTAMTAKVAAMVRPREMNMFWPHFQTQCTPDVHREHGVPLAEPSTHRVSQRVRGGTTDSAVARPRLSQRVEKRSSPAVHVVGEHLASQGAHPASPLVGRLIERCLDRVFDG